MSTREANHDLLGLEEEQEDKEIQDPIELALHGKKFTKITLEDIERVGGSCNKSGQS